MVQQGIPVGGWWSPAPGLAPTLLVRPHLAQYCKQLVWRSMKHVVETQAKVKRPHDSLLIPSLFESSDGLTCGSILDATIELVRSNVVQSLPRTGVSTPSRDQGSVHSTKHRDRPHAAGFGAATLLGRSILCNENRATVLPDLRKNSLSLPVLQPVKQQLPKGNGHIGQIFTCDAVRSCT